jgi:pimeloyl-ACP methyl ester carboxylesterase
MRRAYADGAHGQVHFTTLGAGSPVVLLHWAPANARQYEHVMPVLASMGFLAIAVDVPGYGRSHKDTAGWSCAQMAAEVAHALRAFGIERAGLVGGHLSSAIVAEMSIAAPQRFERIVLDGSPTLTAEQMAHIMASFAGLSPAPTASGSHKTFVWDMTERFLHEWDPDYRATPENFATHYAYMGDYLQMGYAPIRAFLEPANAPKGGLATYQAMQRWPLIPARVLALTATREALRPGHAAAMALLARAPGGPAREHDFPGSHPLMNPARAVEYATVLAQFLRA